MGFYADENLTQNYSLRHCEGTESSKLRVQTKSTTLKRVLLFLKKGGKEKRKKTGETDEDEEDIKLLPEKEKKI